MIVLLISCSTEYAEGPTAKSLHQGVIYVSQNQEAEPMEAKSLITEQQVSQSKEGQRRDISQSESIRHVHEVVSNKA
jgi:hypothetical protein